MEQGNLDILNPRFIYAGQSSWPHNNITGNDQLMDSMGLAHTRQEWIIIWSGRNWILKHAD